MNYEIVELKDLSGIEAGIYSVIIEGDSITLFEHFINENAIAFRKEIRSIVGKLQVIGNTTGARETFFKLNEGKPGDGVCALYDTPDSKLRLYCIRYGNVAVVLGGGGIKPKNIKAWQENDKLAFEAETMMDISNDILQRMYDGDLKWSKDGTRLLGNLKISDEDE